MAYVDQGSSGNRLVAIGIVAIIHVVVGVVLIRSLSYEAVANLVEEMTAIEITEEEEEIPEEEELPEPEEVPETVPPPPVVPPPPINISTRPPDTRTTEVITEREPTPQPTKRCPDGSTVFENQQCAGPATQTCADGNTYPANQACPAMQTCWNGTVIRQSLTCPAEPPKFQPKGAEPRNNRGGWVTTGDYRQSWINRDYAGTVSFNVSVGTNGRVSACSVTGGNAPQALKDATCRLIQRRARFNAATDGNGEETTGSYSGTVRWQIPE